MIQDEPTHEIYVVPELYRSKTVSANNDLFEGKWLPENQQQSTPNSSGRLKKQDKMNSRHDNLQNT